ncbi:MAG: glycosyltransferase family 4 protein [Oscillospiraceae bacterium]|nr:glycosyltransferase family 4 protein [Oscillospiraceae bacterium]
MDFCVIQTRFYPLSVAAAVACRKHRVKSLVIDHSTGHMPMGNGIVGKIAALYEHIACGIIRKCTGGFYGVSEAVSRWLEHFGVKSEGQLYNAVDMASISNELMQDVVDFRKKLSLAENTKIISFAGRLIPEKGVEILINAFEKCGFENTALLIAGDGALYEKLSAQKKENVYLLGSLPHNNTLQLMEQSEVYCLPTMYAEGFPTTFLEAAACGCPVITTVTGGSSEFMPDDSYGIELKKLDEDTLAQALEKAMSDILWRKTAAEKAFANLQDNFVWEKTCDRLEKIALDKINN